MLGPRCRRRKGVSFQSVYSAMVPGRGDCCRGKGACCWGEEEEKEPVAGVEERFADVCMPDERLADFAGFIFFFC